MNISDLKKLISGNNREYLEHTLSWVVSDYSSRIIAEHYINIICDKFNLTKKLLDSMSQIPDPGFGVDTNLYIISKTDVIEDRPNCIILCDKSFSKDCVRIPPLEIWQFTDYIRAKVPGMSQADVEWLATQYNVTDSRVKEFNFRRFENDLDKVAIFPESRQADLFDELYNSGEYNTISSLTIFDLTTALVKKDKKTIREVLRVYDYIDSKPHVWLLKILVNNFRNIVGIQLGNNTAEDLGISDKQYFTIKKYNCGYYSPEQLTRIYHMLTNAEYMYKFGGLQMDELSDYIICKILKEID